VSAPSWRKNQAPSPAEIREYLAGNLCRCGAYLEIIAAVQRASAVLRARARQ